MKPQDSTETASESSLKNEPSQTSWFENISSLVIALLVVFAVRSSIIEPFKIPSGSMIPTLFVGDHIFVNKSAYGLKLPFSDWVGHPITLVKKDPPKRGDIIVFTYPKNHKLNFIKRVVGVPGDVIEIQKRQLYINQTLVEQKQLDGETAKKIFTSLNDPKFTQDNITIYEQKLDTNKPPFTMQMDKSNFLGGDSFGPISVPPGKLFVMGDNRDYSNDSRFWGFVPFEFVKGKAVMIWFSLWLDFSKKNYYFEPSRIGTKLN